jgi:hypothetical protein
VVEPREKSAVFVNLAYERVDLLFERQLDADTDRAFMRLGFDRVSPFVGRLHKAGTAATDYVATHLRQLSGEFLNFVISRGAGLEARGAEDGHAVILSGRAAKTRQLVNDFPETGHCTFEKRNSRVFVAEANDVGLPEG